jgi:hypothetical protein
MALHWMIEDKDRAFEVGRYLLTIKLPLIAFFEAKI